jgi:FKBP-type peptidyl-prolyl cis-trans isomerase
MRSLNTFSLLILTLSTFFAAVFAELGIEVTKAAECARKTEDGDTISVHYRGTLQSDGSEFDSSYNRGTPFEFDLGKGQVIEGWDKGLLGMCIGEARKLTIPPGLGYGNHAVGTIPADSTLSEWLLQLRELHLDTNMGRSF